LFKNETNREPYKLVLPGCSFRCPLEQFAKLTEPIIPENWIEECQLTSEQVYSSTERARFMQVLSTTGNIIIFYLKGMFFITKVLICSCDWIRNHRFTAG
jgi:hypothetical protein